MGRSRRILAATLASLIVFGACGGNAGPSVSSPPATVAPTAPPTLMPSAIPEPTPTPVPTPDVDALIDGVLASLRDPALAIEFEVTGQTAIDGTTFEDSGTIAVVGPNLAGTYVLQPYDIRSSEVSVGGKVWLRDGNGRWARDDQMPAPVPTLASALTGTPRIERWSEVTLASTRLIRAEMSGFDLDLLVQALGMSDPGTEGAKGIVALLVTPTGKFTAMKINATFAAAAGQAPLMSVDRTLMVTKLAKAGEPGAPVVAAPKDFWLRHASDRFGYVVLYPPSMRLKSADNVDTFDGAGSQQLVIWAAMNDSGDTLDSLAKAEVARLKKGGIKVVSQKTVSIDEVDARRIEVSYSGGGKPVWGVKIVMLHQDVQYWLTWVNLSSKKKTDLPILEELLTSFRSAF
jgi:hypothetical protein